MIEEKVEIAGKLVHQSIHQGRMDKSPQVTEYPSIEVCGAFFFNRGGFSHPIPCKKDDVMTVTLTNIETKSEPTEEEISLKQCRVDFEEYQKESWDNMSDTQRNIWFPIFQAGWKAQIEEN